MLNGMQMLALLQMDSAELDKLTEAMQKYVSSVEQSMSSKATSPPPVPTVNVDQHGGDCSGGDDES